jgi:hypothetical protein
MFFVYKNINNNNNNIGYQIENIIIFLMKIKDNFHFLNYYILILNL